MQTTICCIAKNEDRYIHEWIAYHLKLGFDKIYIYIMSDNDDTTYNITIKQL